MNLSETVIGQRALESICRLPSTFDSLTKELKRANDLKEIELGLNKKHMRLDE